MEARRALGMEAPMTAVYPWTREPGRIARHGCAGPAGPPGALHVLTIRACVGSSEVPSFIRDALHEIRNHIEAHHVEVQGPPFAICRPAPAHHMDVEVGWPVRRASGTDRVACCTLPTGMIGRSTELGG